MIRFPFLLILAAAFCCHLCRGSDAAVDTITADAAVLEVSPLPPIDSIDYPDCDFTVLLELPANGDKPRRFLGVVPGYRAKKLTVLAPYFTPGAKLSLHLAPEAADSGESAASAQKPAAIVDVIADPELPFFRISQAAPAAILKNWMDLDLLSGSLKFTPLIIPKSDAVKFQTWSQAEIKRLDGILAEALKPDNIEKLQSNLKNILAPLDASKDAVIVKNVDGRPYILWKQHRFSLVKNTLTRSTNLQSSVAAIRSIDDFFRARGVRLVVVPVPTPEEFSMRYFLPAGFAPPYRNVNRTTLIRDLLAAGVDAYDLLPGMFDTPRSNQFFWFNESTSDPHATARANAIFADALLTHVQSTYSFLGGEAIPPAPDGTPIPKRINSTHGIEFQGKNYGPFLWANYTNASDALSNGSAIQIIGDSFCTGSFSAAMAARSKNTVSRIANGGGAPLMGRILPRRAAALSPNAKVCFFVFSAMYLDTPWQTAANDTAAPSAVIPADKLTDTAVDGKHAAAPEIALNAKTANLTFQIPASFLPQDIPFSLEFAVETNGMINYSISASSKSISGIDELGFDRLKLNFPATAKPTPLSVSISVSRRIFLPDAPLFLRIREIRVFSN